MTRRAPASAPVLAPIVPPVALPRRRPAADWRVRLASFLAVAGPGLIVTQANNDAGAVATYTEAGARFGLALLPILLVLLPITYLVQEASARLGIATGEGLTTLVARKYGRAWGALAAATLVLSNGLTLLTEFAAIALVARALGVSPLIAVPTAAALLIALVASGSYRRWERVVVGLCVLDLVWLALAWRLGGGHAGLPASAAPSLAGGAGPLLMVMAIVGTTIAPWQLFFGQRCVAEKGLGPRTLRSARWDILIGAVATIVVAGAMMLAGDAARRAGIVYRDPAQMAMELGRLLPSAGTFVRDGLLLMTVNAAVLGATAISLSSAWAFGEITGEPCTLDAGISGAPRFFGAYALGVGATAGVVLLPRLPLADAIIAVQIIAGLVLPPTMAATLLLLGDERLVRRTLRGPNWARRLSWAIAGGLALLAVGLAIESLLRR